MNILAALVVGANRYSRNNNSAHLRSSVCCRRNLGVMRLQVLKPSGGHREPDIMSVWPESNDHAASARHGVGVAREQ